MTDTRFFADIWCMGMPKALKFLKQFELIEKLNFTNKNKIEKKEKKVLVNNLNE